MLADADMVATDHTHFIEKLSECYGEVNMVHPFREGRPRPTPVLRTLAARATARCGLAKHDAERVDHRLHRGRRM